MMIWTARLTRKKTLLAAGAAALLVLLVLLLAVLGGRTGEAPPPAGADLHTNADRTAYLRSLGWEVETEPVETLQFLLPETLEEPYLTYNELQKQQGLDLERACGKQVLRCTYAVTNYPGRPKGVQANLYICEDALAAGDICCVGSGGFQTVLAFPREESR